MAKAKPESKLVKASLEYLRYQPQTMAWRNNSGRMRWTDKRGSARSMGFGAPGSPDILGVCRGRAIGIECKAKGNKQTDVQRLWQEAFTNCGGLYILAYNLDDIEDGLRKEI